MTYRDHKTGGVRMAFDAITGIAQAEDAARTAVQYAQAQAKQMVADAENAGRASVEAAVVRAERELETLKAKSDEKSIAEAKQMLKSLETKKTILRSGAQVKLDSAAALVVERIVSS